MIVLISLPMNVQWLLLAVVAGANLAVVAICTFAARRLDTTRDLPPLLVTKPPDAREIAYLRGGTNEVTRVLVFDLLQRGYLKKSATSLTKLMATTSQLDSDRALANEEEILHFFTAPKSARDLFRSSSIPDRVKDSCAEIDAYLQKEQLLSTNVMQRTAAAIGMLGFVIIAVLDASTYFFISPAMRTFLGSPPTVVFLAIAAIVLAFRTLKLRLPRQSFRGRQHLEQVQQQLIRGKVATSQLTLHVAAFGVSVSSRDTLRLFWCRVWAECQRKWFGRRRLRWWRWRRWRWWWR